MPFNGFICEVSGEQCSPEECVACAMQGGKDGCDFTPPLLRGIILANQPRGFTGWSATQLGSCPRKERLKAKHPWYAKPSELYWAWRGTVGHSAVEGAHGLDRVIAETRFSATVNTVLVTGTPDVVYVDRRHLQDYKTCKQVPGPQHIYTCLKCGKEMQRGRWKLRRGHKKTCPYCDQMHDPKAVRQAHSTGPPTPYGSHVGQVSVYRWLLHRNGIRVDSSEIVYLDMAGVKRLPVELWPVERTRTWIQERLQALTASQLPPPLAKDSEETWQCKYCHVDQVCRRLVA